MYISSFTMGTTAEPAYVRNVLAHLQAPTNEYIATVETIGECLYVWTFTQADAESLWPLAQWLAAAPGL